DRGADRRADPAFAQRVEADHMTTGSRSRSLPEYTGTIQNASPSNQNIASCSYVYAMSISDRSSSSIATLRSQCDSSGLHASMQTCLTPSPAVTCCKLAASASFTTDICSTPIGFCAVTIPNDRSKPILRRPERTSSSTALLRSIVNWGEDRKWSNVSGKLPHAPAASDDDGGRLKGPGSGGQLERQRNNKRAPFAHLARHRHVTAQQLRKAARHAQTESGTTDSTSAWLLDLPEGVEYLVAVLVGNADPRIADYIANDRTIVLNDECDTARRRELDRVGEQVHENLPQLSTVGTHRERIPDRNNLQRKPLLARQRLYQCRGIVGDLVGIDVFGLNNLPSCVHARIRQNLIDEVKQMLGARLHSPELVLLRVVDGTGNSVGQQLLISDDRRERRAKLVRHHREKIALRGVCTLGSLPCPLLAGEELLSNAVALVSHVRGPVHEPQEDRDRRHYVQRNAEWRVVPAALLADETQPAQKKRNRNSGRNKAPSNRSGCARIDQQLGNTA